MTQRKPRSQLVLGLRSPLDPTYMKLAAAATMILCLAAAGCQSSINPSAAERISPVRLEYIEEFKRIDRAGKGRITLEEATAYYSVRFSELDKNRDGFLDVAELESILPAMVCAATA